MSEQLVRALQAASAQELPLHKLMARGSYVVGGVRDVVVLRETTQGEQIRARVGLRFASVIAGCSCADDPTPIDEMVEYAEVEVELDPRSGRIRLLEPSP